MIITVMEADYVDTLLLQIEKRLRPRYLEVKNKNLTKNLEAKI